MGGTATMAPRRKIRRGDPYKAVAYLRVSTEDQNLGPQAQQRAIAAYCKREGITLLATFTDHGVSGGAELDKRPALLDALDAIEEQEAGALIVAKRDRLARDVVIAATIERLVERAGARVRSADGVASEATPEGALMRTLVDAFAQYERAVIAARTKAALAVKSSRGERVGSIPYGKRLAADGVRLVNDPAEQKAVRLARKLRDKGLSLRAIGAELELAGHTPRGSGAWHPQTVSNVLREGQQR